MSIFKKKKSESLTSLKDSSHVKVSRLKLAMNHGISFKDMLSSTEDWAKHYRESNYLSDLVYYFYVDKKLSPALIEKVSGESRANIEKKVDSFVNSLEAKTEKDPEEALRSIRAVFGAKNPLLYILHYCNVSKQSVFKTKLHGLFSSHDYNYPKTVSLLRRNLVLVNAQQREKIQAKYHIDTKDLKISKKREVLYFCQSCMSENWISMKEHKSDPVASCKCGSVVTPSRQMIGYRSESGLVFKCGTKQVHTIDGGSVTKLETKEFFDREFDRLEQDDAKLLTQLMLWHHPNNLKQCGCPECNS
ncbi:hypothetical protein [Vibrio crassostreae]|uniref:hypothetical protein n=1 Tax=Vibrio crassostreae TaxID=246167 RepID=UPI001B30C54C|nr:hypothetical protein [Vibrio crassostreae]